MRRGAINSTCVRMSLVLSVTTILTIWSGGFSRWCNRTKFTGSHTIFGCHQSDGGAFDITSPDC